jgi:hypothetical protein
MKTDIIQANCIRCNVPCTFDMTGKCEHRLMCDSCLKYWHECISSGQLKTGPPESDEDVANMKKFLTCDTNSDPAVVRVLTHQNKPPYIPYDDVYGDTPYWTRILEQVVDKHPITSGDVRAVAENDVIYTRSDQISYVTPFETHFQQ